MNLGHGHTDWLSLQFDYFWWTLLDSSANLHFYTVQPHYKPETDWAECYIWYTLFIHLISVVGLIFLKHAQNSHSLIWPILMQVTSSNKADRYKHNNEQWQDLFILQSSHFISHYQFHKQIYIFAFL